MSRRKRDPSRPPSDAVDRRVRAAPPVRRPAARPHRAGGRAGGRILRDLAVLLVAFGAGVGIAELFGAANLGVAFGVGQIVFAIALVVLLTRG